jgi:hypothetical protein
MIKRASNILLIIILVVVTGGIPVTWHYCGSKAMAFSIFTSPKPCCNGHCDKCHNVFKFNKLNDYFEVSGLTTCQPLPKAIKFQTLHLVLTPGNSQISFISGVNHKRKFLIKEPVPLLARIGNLRC